MLSDRSGYNIGMNFRAYDESCDKPAAHRIWYECGWLRDDDTAALDTMLQCSRSHVALIDGDPECLVQTAMGTVRYLKENLPWACVLSVTTSRIARKQSFALKLTAQAIAADVAEGAIVAGLGMFEQGYYDQLGFGSGGYVRMFGVNPAKLKVKGASRVPTRLTKDDYEAMAANRVRCATYHGSVTTNSPLITRAAIEEGRKRDFGLGFTDGPNGELTHHLWMYMRGKVENGPYSIGWMAWETREQFLELLGLIKNLSDQVHLVWVRETHSLQLQDLIERPFQHRALTTNSDFDNRMRVIAIWQMRICNLAKCLQRTHLSCSTDLRFNLTLSDPIEEHLPNDAPWRGVAGEYVVTLGKASGCEAGSDASLPRLTASVGTFSRLWLGVRPASSLNITDDLEGPRDLLDQLDETLRLPEPETGCDF